MACWPCRSPAGRFRQAAAAGHHLDTVSADQFLLQTPGSGWPGDGYGGPLDRPDIPSSR
jgi:hypothetical protein